MTRITHIALDDANMPPPTPEIDQERKVAMFDLLEENSFFTAGGDRLLLYMPRANIFECWNLRTGKKERAASSRLRGRPRAILMALDNPRRAVVTYVGGYSDPDRMDKTGVYLALFDVDRLKLVDQSEYEPLSDVGPRNSLPTQASANLMRLASLSWARQAPSFLIDLKARSSLRLPYEGNGMTFSHDGRVVYQARGVAYAADGHRVKQLGGSQFFAVVGGHGLLQIKDDKTLILRDRHFNPLWSKPSPVKRWGIDPYYCRIPILTHDRVWPLARVDRLVLIDNLAPAARIIVHRLNLPKPGQPMHDPGPVRPGQTWAVQLALPPNATLKIEDAPAGLRFDKQSRRLHWTVPKATAEGQYLVLVNVRAPNTEEHYLRYWIRVRTA
ncbi:hypothetical protein LCGC14_2324980 [marine sediment metagenome]|uniref:Uncharacterized protein n=1 Tax=marine sediment metagenome TaxID=412755 RepID=A0A0F9EU33_9ZZZZ